MKKIAVLIDPEKSNDSFLRLFASAVNNCHPDFILIGGSTFSGSTTPLIRSLRALLPPPSPQLVLFPGSASQFSPEADALLFLSLISGRNPRFLIDEHVKASPAIARSSVRVIPTGYMLIDGGVTTSVQRVSQTQPLAPDNLPLITSTALAGKLLGLQALYLEAGSGAAHPVPAAVITAVKQATHLPLIVGGGLRDTTAVQAALQAGADTVVIGNALEDDPTRMPSLVHAVHSWNV